MGIIVLLIILTSARFLSEVTTLSVHDVCEQRPPPRRQTWHMKKVKRVKCLFSFESTTRSEAHLWDKMQQWAAAAVCWPEPVGSAKNWGWGESWPSCSSQELVSLVGAGGHCGERPEKQQEETWHTKTSQSSVFSVQLHTLNIYYSLKKSEKKNDKHDYTIKVTYHIVEKSSTVLGYKNEWNNVSPKILKYLTN